MPLYLVTSRTPIAVGLVPAGPGDRVDLSADVAAPLVAIGALVPIVADPEAPPAVPATPSRRQRTATTKD